MRIVHAAETQRCYECGTKAEIVVARGYRLWYTCWDHATELLEAGGVIVGGDLASPRR